MTRVTLDGLTVLHPGAAEPALHGLSLEVEPGTLTALLGPSGCGKTTALKAIAGLVEPTGGDVRLDGRSVLHRAPERRGAVMVFQDHLLFPHMSVADNVGFGLRMRGVARAETQARVAEMLDLVRLGDLGRRRPAALSGGQRQRAALARALVVRPDVLLLDEPLSNLDAHLRVEMRGLVRDLQRRTGVTTIFVTHDQEEAVVVADRVALILEGRLRQHGRAEAFYRRPADEAVARFFGGRNFVPGTSDGAVFDCALGRLVLPPGARTGPGTLTFRPESVRIGAGARNALRARLVERTFLGTQTRLRLAVGEVAIEAVTSPDDATGLEAGAELPVTLPRDALWVLA